LEALQSQPPKGVGFPDPLSGTLNTARSVQAAKIQFFRPRPCRASRFCLKRVFEKQRFV
jgi:hypothetical protein